MKLLKELIVIDSRSDMPVYLQIANAFIHHIRLGRLRKGLRLPGSREVASLLNVNRMTVVAAYSELESQGWIEVRPRNGTFVSEALPLLSPKSYSDKTGPFTFPDEPRFPFYERHLPSRAIRLAGAAPKLVINDGFPDPRLVPMEQLLRNMRRFSRMKSHKKYLMYGHAQGTDFLRETLAEFLSDTRGLPVTPANILITHGAQMGIFLAANLLLRPKDVVVVGQPGYTMVNRTLEQLGASLQRVPVDDEGLDVDVIEKLCPRKKIKFVYVISHHHNPTTVTLSPERRIRLLELAVQHRFAVLEDDYDYDFHYASKPIMPMASLDTTGSVIYIGTLTKTLAPAVRLGFMVAPTKFINSAVNLRRMVDMQGNSLLENGIAELYRDGTMNSHIRKAVKLYRERRDHFCQLLRSELGHEVSFKIPDGGMSVWVEFQKNTTRIAEKAYAKGLLLRDGTEFNTEKVRYNAVRMGFASLNFREQRMAVEILRECLN
jgi:GntR family transcriptional regulator/MocR family aminotransferase